MSDLGLARTRAGLMVSIGTAALLLAACGVSNGGGSKGGDHSSSGSGIAAPGVTATTIKIGFGLTDAASSVNTGAKGTAQGDEKSQANAVVAYINAHGGIAGRKITPVFNIHPPSETNAATGFQADCSAFTEDNKVFAVYSSRTSASSSMGPLTSCLVQRHTVFVVDTNSALSNQQLAGWAPYVYAPTLFAADRAKAYVDGVAAQGYFDGGAKVGIISFDEPGAHVEVDTMAGEIAAKGGTVVDKQFMTPYSDPAGFAAAGAQVASMVLRFKSKGIDHVMFAATYGAGGFLFPTQAKAQKYSPRYAMTTQEFPQVIAANAPKGQLHGAVGIGWDPGWDVDTAQDPHDNTAQTQCTDIFHRAGADPQGRAAVRRALGICDALFFLKAGLDHASSLNADGLRSTVTKSGFSYQSAVTHQSTFPGNRYDGVADVRNLAFDDTCSCWKYAGEWQETP